MLFPILSSIMKENKTFYSFLLNVINILKNTISGIEYLYESSLVPQRIKGKYYLYWDKKKYLTKLINRIKSFYTQKTDYIDVVEPSAKPISKKPRIVHMIVWLGGIGGAPRLILDLANGLKDKYAMEGITLSDDFYYKYSNFRIHHFSRADKTLDFLLSNPPDILHTYYYGDWKGFHKNFEMILRSKLPSAIIENLLVPIHIYRSSRINHYVYCSNYIREIQHKKLDNETIIYPGVDLKEFVPNENIKKRPNSVGMAYRLWDDKIDQSTIEMFIGLVKKRPSTIVYIIGGGFNFHHYVERTRIEGVRSNFYFTGEVGYKELPSWYDKFGIFVAPVHNESYGLVVPYAMAKKIPVVAYRRGVLPELLGDINSIVNTSNEMVDELVYLLDNPNIAIKKASGGRERVIKLFSMGQMIKQYDILYQKLLNDN